MSIYFFIFFKNQFHKLSYVKNLFHKEKSNEPRNFIYWKSIFALYSFFCSISYFSQSFFFITFQKKKDILCIGADDSLYFYYFLVLILHYVSKYLNEFKNEVHFFRIKRKSVSSVNRLTFI